MISMTFQFTLFYQIPIYLPYLASVTNASSSQSASSSPILFSAVAAFIGAIGGSIVSGHYLIKKVREGKKLEFFGEVFNNFYAPFQEIAEEIINQNEISNENSAEVKRLIDDNKRFILMCPRGIKKEIVVLRENLRMDNQDEAIKSIGIVKRRIDKLTKKFKI